MQVINMQANLENRIKINASDINADRKLHLDLKLTYHREPK